VAKTFRSPKGKGGFAGFTRERIGHLKVCRQGEGGDKTGVKEFFSPALCKKEGGEGKMEREPAKGKSLRGGKEE